jgi:thioredoxin-like negative regulator of GroEL
MNTKKNTAALRERPILFGFAVQRKQANGEIVISVRWLYIFSAFMALFLVAWISTAGALYFWFKHKKNFDTVNFTKMVALPFRMDEHRKELGNYHVNKGLEYFDEGNYRDALRFLRQGITRAPSNFEGRILLAQFYEQLLKRPDVAAGLLSQGLELGGANDNDYLKETLRVLLRHQLDEDVQEIADKYLPKVVEINDRNRILAFAAAQANFLRGNYDAADDYISSYEIMVSVEGVMLSSQISWNRGHEKTAIRKLEIVLEKFQQNERILMQLSRYFREIGDLDQARKYAVMRNLSNPLSAAPRIELLYIYNKSGDTEREELEIRRILKQFSDNNLALQAIANFAAETGNVGLARRTYEEALENEFTIDAFALLLIESHLVKKDYEGALSFSEELDKERPAWLTKRRYIFNSLRAVASYGQNRPDFGDIYLNEFLNGENIAPEQYFAVARRFLEIERTKEARKVLMHAYNLTPKNQKVLAELLKVELSMGYTENLNKLLKQFLLMRRPQPEIILEAYQKLGSDLFIFTPNRENLLIELNNILRESNEMLMRYQKEEEAS